MYVVSYMIKSKVKYICRIFLFGAMLFQALVVWLTIADSGIGQHFIADLSFVWKPKMIC